MNNPAGRAEPASILSSRHGFARADAVIHRDIEPSNMPVEDNDRVRLLDFGISKHLDALGAMHDEPLMDHRAGTTHRPTRDEGRIEPGPNPFAPEQA